MNNNEFLNTAWKCSLQRQYYTKKYYIHCCWCIECTHFTQLRRRRRKLTKKLVGSVVGGINICNSQYLRQKAGIRLFHQRKWNKSEDVIVYIHIWRKALLGTMGLLQPKKPFVHTEWKYTIFGLGRLVLSILHECEHKIFLLCRGSK